MAIEKKQDIFCIEKGYGKVVILFIHGWYQNSQRSFLPYINHFSKEYKVIALDLPGHGNSYKDKKSRYSMGLAFKTCSEIIEEKCKNAHSIIVFAHSTGCYLALKLALFRSSKVSKLILVSPLIDFSPFNVFIKGYLNRSDSSLKAMLLFRALKDQFPFCNRKLVSDTKKKLSKIQYFQKKMKNHPFHAALGYFRSFISLSLDPILKENILPTLLLYADSDTVSSHEDGVRYASVIPKSTLKVIENSSSHSVHLDKKDEVISVVESFLDDTKKKKIFGIF